MKKAKKAKKKRKNSEIRGKKAEIYIYINSTSMCLLAHWWNQHRIKLYIVNYTWTTVININGIKVFME